MRKTSGTTWLFLHIATKKELPPPDTTTQSAHCTTLYAHLLSMQSKSSVKIRQDALMTHRGQFFIDTVLNALLAKSLPQRWERASFLNSRGMRVSFNVSEHIEAPSLWLLGSGYSLPLRCNWSSLQFFTVVPYQSSSLRIDAKREMRTDVLPLQKGILTKAP